jgi:hypothetical protein
MTRRYRFIHMPILMTGLMFAVASTAVAQGPPVIPGVTGTIATKGTVEREYAGVKKIASTTADGVERLFGANSGDKLRGLHEGDTVLVRYVAVGRAGAHHVGRDLDQADRVVDQHILNVTEGTVMSIDRFRERIAIRFENGKVEKYRLTSRATVDAGKDPEKAAAGADRVRVSYRNAEGDRIEQVFKRTSKPVRNVA